MRRTLLALALVIAGGAITDNASANDWLIIPHNHHRAWDRLNCYKLRSSQQILMFPERNQMLIRESYGDYDIIVSEPIQHFGIPGYRYQFDRYGNIDPYASGLIRQQFGIFGRW